MLIKAIIANKLKVTLLQEYPWNNSYTHTAYNEIHILDIHNTDTHARRHALTYTQDKYERTIQEPSATSSSDSTTVL